MAILLSKHSVWCKPNPRANCAMKNTSTHNRARPRLVSPWDLHPVDHDAYLEAQGGHMSDSPSDFNSTNAGVQTVSVSSEGFRERAGFRKLHLG